MDGMTQAEKLTLAIAINRLAWARGILRRNPRDSDIAQALADALPMCFNGPPLALGFEDLRADAENIATGDPKAFAARCRAAHAALGEYRVGAFWLLFAADAGEWLAAFEMATAESEAA